MGITVADAVAHGFAGDVDQFGGLTGGEGGKRLLINRHADPVGFLVAKRQAERLERGAEFGGLNGVGFEAENDVAEFADDSIDFGQS